MKKFAFLVSALVCFGAVADDFSDERAEIGKKVLKKSSTTSAKLQQGTELVDIDFGNAEDVKKIKAYDTVYLEEGKYTNFGGLTAKGVRFIGKGIGKTFISTDDKALPVIPVDATEFWDSSLVNVFFQPPSSEGIWTVACELVGKVSVESSNQLVYSVNALVSDTAKREYWGANQGLFSWYAAPYQDINRKNSFVFPELTKTENAFTKAQDIFNNSRGNEHFFRFDAKVAQALAPLWKTMIGDLFASSLTLAQKAGYLGSIARIRFYIAKSKLVESGDGDEKAFATLRQKAEASQKKGNSIAALVLWEEANQVSNYAHYDEVLATAAPVLEAWKKSTTCLIGVDNSAGNSTVLGSAFVAAMNEKFALVSMGSMTSDCQIRVVNNGGLVDTKTQDGQILAKKDVYVDSEETRERKLKAREMEVAAERAADRARQANLDAHVERMKDTAARMEAGRVQVNGNTMTYGSGNWNGQASAGTIAARDSAAQRASDLSGNAAALAAAQKGDQVKIGTDVTLKSTITRIFQWSPSATVRANGKTAQINGPSQQEKEIKDCILHRTNNGNFAHVSDCKITNERAKLNATQVVAQMLPEIRKALGDKFLKATSNLGREIAATGIKGLKEPVALVEAFSF